MAFLMECFKCRSIPERRNVRGSLTIRNDGVLRRTMFYVSWRSHVLIVSNFLLQNCNGILIELQARRHEVLSGGGGARGRFIGTQTHPPPNFSLSSDFVHFILKCWKMKKIRLRYSNIQISGGSSPQFSKVRGPDPRVILSCPTLYGVLWTGRSLNKPSL